MTELKACPFCGGRAIAAIGENGIIGILCKNCHAQVRWSILMRDRDFKGNEEKWAENWNRREGG